MTGVNFSVNLGRVLISDTVLVCCNLTGASICGVFVSFCTLERTFPECDTVDGMY